MYLHKSAYKHSALPKVTQQMYTRHNLDLYFPKWTSACFTI